MGTSRKPCRASRPRRWCSLAKLTFTSRETHRCTAKRVADEKRRPEDSENEVANMRPGIATMEAFPSIWGHWAGGESQAHDTTEIC